MGALTERLPAQQTARSTKMFFQPGPIAKTQNKPVIQRFEDVGMPVAIPIITSREIIMPCPTKIDNLVPGFILEGREHAIMRLNGEHNTSPSKAEIAGKAFQYLGQKRQTTPAVDPRNPTDSELALACAEHYSYMRFAISNELYSITFARGMVETYTFLKDQLSHISMEWLLSVPTDGVTPVKATRCQNDWGHRGIDKGWEDWTTDHPDTN